MSNEPTNGGASTHETAGFLERIFAEQQSPLTRYAARLLGDADRARDVVQDAFVKLMAQAPGAVDGHAVEWLFTVCRNRAMDVLRKENRMKRFDEGERSASRPRSRVPGASSKRRRRRRPFYV
jgi:RNA polymerase sigma-70 factor (ECF subfamily)